MQIIRAPRMLSPWLPRGDLTSECASHTKMRMKRVGTVHHQTPKNFQQILVVYFADLFIKQGFFAYFPNILRGEFCNTVLGRAVEDDPIGRKGCER